MGYIHDALNELDEAKNTNQSIYSGYKKKQKKSEKGGAWGWFQKPNAGNVEYNIWRFNHMHNDEVDGKKSEPVEAKTAAEAGNDGIGGDGGLVMGGETVASAGTMAGDAGAVGGDFGGGMGESLEETIDTANWPKYILISRGRDQFETKEEAEVKIKEYKKLGLKVKLQELQGNKYHNIINEFENELQEDLDKDILITFECKECGNIWTERIKKDYFEDEEDLKKVVDESEIECPDCDSLATASKYEFAENLSEALDGEEEFDPLAQDEKFRYQLLSRCISDCKYFVEHPANKHLWAGNVEDQIKLMRDLYNSFDDEAKPEWTSMEEIDMLYNQMKDIPVEESLNESLSEEDKVDLWNNGQRIVNVKACSDDKLKRYYEIADKKGYLNICKDIEADANRRGLTLPNATNTPSQSVSTSVTSTPTPSKPKTTLEELIEIADQKKPRVVTNGMTDQEIYNYEDALFNELVPSSGNADTLAGEILSAWNYGVYRYYNDGDWFYGFGKTWNTSCQQIIQYLKDKVGPGLGRAASYAGDMDEFVRQGNKLILNLIFKDKLYDVKSGIGWRDYRYK